MISTWLNSLGQTHQAKPLVPVKSSGVQFGAGQNGSALVGVLAILTLLGVVVTLFMEHSAQSILDWEKDENWMQALYLAESGLAHQLYMEKYGDSLGEIPAETESHAFAEEEDKHAFRFHLDSLLPQPEVWVDRLRAYLEITSRGSSKDQHVTIFAKFGQALNDSIFGAALTLDNEEVLKSFPSSSIVGAVRVKKKPPAAGEDFHALPQNFSLDVLTNSFADQKYRGMKAELDRQLSREGGDHGNKYYTFQNPPDFIAAPDPFFPLGDVYIENTDNDYLVVKGPGRIFANGDIRVRGRIHFQDVELYAGRDVVFEDTVTSQNLGTFSGKNTIVSDKCRLDIQATAGGNITLRNTSQTTLGSVLLSTGQMDEVNGSTRATGKERTPAKQPVNAIRVENEAKARGFLIAAGPRARVVLSKEQGKVEGVIISSHEVWLSGRVLGAVLAKKLRCNDVEKDNCLGTGKIDRSKLPPELVQPLELGNQNRRNLQFKLMRWNLL